VTGWGSCEAFRPGTAIDDAEGHGLIGTVQVVVDGEDGVERGVVAARVAGIVGAELRAVQERHPGGGRALSDEGDQLGHRRITELLQEWCPGDLVRSEEGDAIAGARALWVVDPLDGSREFGEGRDDWAVHVALAVDGEPVAGAVALPGLGLVLSTVDPPRLKDLAEPPRMVVSRTRPPALASALAARLGAEMIPMGSAGAKIAAVVRGEADIYVHAGGQYEWDSAAPVAVALAAGYHASRIDGSPLRYGQQDPWLPDLLVCHPSLAESALRALVDLV